MGKYLILLGGIVLLLLYLYLTNPRVRHYYHLFMNKNSIYNEKIIYKKLRTAKDLNGNYVLSIKYPEIYALGIEIKHNKLNLNGEKYNWVDNPPLKIKIEIKNKNGKEIYSQVTKGFKTMGLLQNGNIQFDFVHIPLSTCKDCTLSVKLLSGNFLEYEDTEDMLYLYFSPTGYI